jgi:hypothetical protein
MKKILSLMLCVGLVLCFLACGQADSSSAVQTTVADDGDPYTFETVAKAKAAIKKEPVRYESSRITVKGSIVTRDNGIILSDFRGDGGLMFIAEALRYPNITIVMSSKKTSALLESGDYVKIIGTVTITETEIYLDDCEYKMIASIYD